MTQVYRHRLVQIPQMDRHGAKEMGTSSQCQGKRIVFPPNAIEEGLGMAFEVGQREITAGSLEAGNRRVVRFPTCQSGGIVVSRANLPNVRGYMTIGMAEVSRVIRSAANAGGLTESFNHRFSG